MTLDRTPSAGARAPSRTPEGDTGADLSFPQVADSSPWRQRFLSIHKVLRERITLLHYRPGRRLNVNALAAEFGVSRTPIRSVLQRLEYQGLVVTRHGVGTTVTEIDFGLVREATLFRMRLAELIGDLRPRAPTEEAVRSMTQACNDCRALVDRPNLEAFGRIDIRLHESVCSLIGHSLLLQVYDDLYYRTARMWFHFLPRLDWNDEIAILASDIEATLRAMQRGDTRAVGFLVRNAVSATLIRLADLFQEAELVAHEDRAGRGDAASP